MLTLGQYLQLPPSPAGTQRYVSPEEFDEMKAEALQMGFTHAACGPFVMSSFRTMPIPKQGMEVK